MLIRGKEGTSVNIKIQSGKEIRDLTIVREKVQIKLVDTRMVDNAFYLKFAEVGIGTDSLFRNALQKFIQTGSKRLILDLRNNPGGSLFETRKILNYFVAK